MKAIRQIAALILTLVLLIPHAEAQLPFSDRDAKSAASSTSQDLERLQGTWEGFLVGDAAKQKVKIIIAKDSLHFHRDTNFWFKTTFTLPPGKDPKQLHATIKDRPDAAGVSIGQVVKAFFRIQNEKLTLATIGDDGEETLTSFETAGTRYELRKVTTSEKPGPTAKP